MSTHTSPNAQPTPRGNRFLTWLKNRWLGIVVTALMVVLLIQNIGIINSINISLLWIQISAPVWVLLLVLFATGAIAGVSFARSREKARQDSHKK
ncbi:DUF1049 domain-containing protein [Lysinibacter sp. HNR]|uniref:DUF1049 domain-containing protein n=1 Tax=Lysinibacter sp. HNR TaxID=3031408 RepID=UPI002434AD7A|nr:DUF1049 domain-containing protein [Lysinibacter sp. HNR]WGD36664.1 DUF1049 domain-containing protein [Lysinibacter sp. HNR]